KIEPGMMEKEFSFPDFKTALDFVNKVGELAEEEDHHPDIFLSWGKVHIQLTTHSENGLTGKDVHLAKRIETP
ncbi:4a-hydroxytetrahydrobiopterin dehydratase, partial [Candidatus Woesearchaeota archaeon]|nr:4a-hydroxytetrahydrobiopterin dehydratase [Candidatus Woesearchaeota archaeon]